MFLVNHQDYITVLIYGVFFIGYFDIFSTYSIIFSTYSIFLNNYSRKWFSVLISFEKYYTSCKKKKNR